MYIFGPTTRRCSLCYALLFTHTHTTNATLSYSSSNRRHASRCSISSIQRLISSSTKFQRLWRQNQNGIFKNPPMCFRCCTALRQVDQIKTDIEQLDHEKQLLMKRIEHNLSKRALILQAQRRRTNPCLTPPFIYQPLSFNDDEDTEEGEEKPRPPVSVNGHGHGHALSVVQPTAILVGAKRRKCNIAHKINLEDKIAESTASLLKHAHRSSSPIPYPTTKFSPSLIFGSHSSKHHRSIPFSSPINDHDLTNLSFGAACKSFALQTTASSSSSSSAAAAATKPSPFLDPTAGALIAIVSNPHHAALLASQHQQILQSSSISPSSTNNPIDDQHMNAMKSSIQTKKFPCMLCGRDFSNKSNLNRHHSIVHVAIRSFECTRCPKTFKLRQGLKTHMQRCHGVNADEPTFVLSKHHSHHYHHHHHNPHPSSATLIAQTNK